MTELEDIDLGKLEGTIVMESKNMTKKEGNRSDW